MQFLSHEILLVAKFFDPLIAFWVDEKGAHKGTREVGEARGEAESDSMRTQGVHSVVRPTY